MLSKLLYVSSREKKNLKGNSDYSHIPLRYLPKYRFLCRMVFVRSIPPSEIFSAKYETCARHGKSRGIITVPSVWIFFSVSFCRKHSLSFSLLILPRTFCCLSWIFWTGCSLAPLVVFVCSFCGKFQYTPVCENVSDLDAQVFGLTLGESWLSFFYKTFCHLEHKYPAALILSLYPVVDAD